MKLLTIALAAAALLAPLAAHAQTPPPRSAPIQVMVLGAYHMGNPGQDVNNMRVDPVTTPERQRQLEQVAAALARFNPTAIAVERVATDQATLLDPVFPRFTPADLTTSSDERVQIAYRLAFRLRLDRVYGVDEQSDTRDYFPFEAVQSWAREHGQEDRLTALNAPVAAVIADMERRQHTDTVAALLAEINRPDHPVFGPGGQSFYYGLLAFGSGETQPGAALNAGWYERNARIFAKLVQVARPGDRIVLMFGSGHEYWLRHFVQTAPGFQLVEPNDFLRNAER